MKTDAGASSLRLASSAPAVFEAESVSVSSGSCAGSSPDLLASRQPAGAPRQVGRTGHATGDHRGWIL